MTRPWYVALTLITLLAGSACWAADEAQPETADDPNIPLEELRILVRPLTKAQLEVEAEAWFARLTDKAHEIAALELAQRRAAKAPAATQPTTAPVAEGDGNDPSAQRQSLLEQLPELRAQRTALIDRFDVVLTELEAKGGETDVYRDYVRAMAGITVDVTDATEAWSAISGWLTSKEGGIRWGWNIAQFFLTLIVFWVLAGIVRSAVGRAMRMARNVSSLLRDFVVNIAHRLVLFAGLLVAVSMLEVKLAPVLAIIGGAAFVIAFALQGTLSNLASGLMILAYRPFDVGDAVSVAGTAGIVDSMNLVSTQLKTFDNQRVVVPNNSIWGDVITNITGLPTRRIDMTFGISYADDMGKAVAILKELVEKHPLVLKDPAPNIQVHELGDSSVNLICRPWSKTADYWTIYWELQRKVKERFDAEGISIPFPQRDVHLYQASDSTS